MGISFKMENATVVLLIVGIVFNLKNAFFAFLSSIRSKECVIAARNLQILIVRYVTKPNA